MHDGEGVRIRLDSLPVGARFANTCRLSFTQFGAGPPPSGNAAQIELFAAVSPTARNAKFSNPEWFATLRGSLEIGPQKGPRFVPDGPVEQADLGQVFEASGHRYPRRTMALVLDPASSPETAQEQTLLLPDSAQVASGYLEVTTALSIAGSMHAGASSNDTFDMVLVPLTATHAILRFVDEHKAP